MKAFIMATEAINQKLNKNFCNFGGYLHYIFLDSLNSFSYHASILVSQDRSTFKIIVISASFL